MDIGFKSKDKAKLPDGAEVLSKEISLRVEEIENGFILIKRCEYRFQLGERSDWMSIEKKYFSKTNPVKIDEKPLFEKFE